MSTRTTLLSGLLALSIAALTHSDAGAAKEVFQRTKPHVNVGVISQDLDLSGFHRMRGLGVETEAVEAPEPGDPDRKIPGRTTYQPITFERPYTGATDVQAWASEGLRGAIQLRDLTVTLISPSAEPVARFELTSCFPTRWELGTDEKGGAVETIVVVCGRIELG